MLVHAITCRQGAQASSACLTNLALPCLLQQDFFMGARVLSTQMSNTVGACCAQRDANPSCDRQDP